MRYEYTVTKDSGEVELMKAMSWKKLLKSVLLKYPKFSGWCTYINKKVMFRPKYLIMVKLFTNEKETKRAIQAAVDQYNEVYSNNTLAKHKRSRHTKSKTQAPRKLRRNR